MYSWLYVIHNGFQFFYPSEGKFCETCNIFINIYQKTGTINGEFPKHNFICVIRGSGKS